MEIQKYAPARSEPPTEVGRARALLGLTVCLLVLVALVGIPAAAGAVDGDGSDPTANDFFDDFSSDQWATGRYTLVVGSGTLRRTDEGTEEATSTVEKKAFLDWGSRKYEDVEASIDYYVPTTSSGHVSPMIKGRLVNGKLLHLKARYSTTLNGLVIQKFVGGTTTDLGRPATTFSRGKGWKRIVLRAVGDTLTASHYALDSNRENPVHNATEKVALTGQDAVDFGAGVRGDAGRRWVPSDLNWRSDNFRAGVPR